MSITGQQIADAGAITHGSGTSARAALMSVSGAQSTSSATVTSGVVSEGARNGGVLIDGGISIAPPRLRLRRADLRRGKWLRQYRWPFAVLDLIAGVVAVALAYVIRFHLAGHATGHHEADTVLAAVLPAAWVATVALHRGYEGRFVGTGSIEFQRLLRAFVHLTVFVSFVSFVVRAEIARGFVMPVLPVVFVLGCGARYRVRKRRHRRRATGASTTRILAVGDAAAVADFAARIHKDRLAGMSVVGACVPGSTSNDVRGLLALDELRIPVLGDVDSLLEAVRTCGARDVAVLSGKIDGARMRWISWQLEGSGAGLVISPGLLEMGGRRIHIQPVAGVPLLYVDEPTFVGFRNLLKSALDRACALLALLLLLPMMISIGVLIRLTSRGPALFRQVRVGQDGRQFTMFKFRSMCQDAEIGAGELVAHNDLESGPMFKMRNDPRVTPLGRVLRKYSLDELPQLINVLIGSMSLVGPRPPLPQEVAQYGDDVRRRLLVKPGLTGLWQISGRSDLSWEETVRLDLYYVENPSLVTDLVILWKTIFVVLRRSGAY